MASSPKTGLDDFLAHGGMIPQLERLIVDELPPLPERTAAVDARPVMDQAAFYGLAGDVVRAIEPTTEADPVALLASFLTMFGNAVGREPHFMVGDTRHGANLFTVLVGETSRARKGTSQHAPMRLMKYADPEWVLDRVQGGLSSGEGLIWAVRDSTDREDPEEGMVTIEPGVSDKRLLCIEEEFSQLLKTAQRTGNTLTEVIRRSWDGSRPIQTLTKHSPVKATDAHISILAHITKAELRKLLTETELANGFANRFLWVRVHRVRLLANPQPLAPEVVEFLGSRIERVLAFAKDVGTVAFDAEAAAVWPEVYAELERDRPGLAGDTTGRSSPMVLRLSLIYALLDRSPFIRVTHLEAAVAVWEYVDASVTSTFGDLTGDAVADRIMGMLRVQGPMAQDAIRNEFYRNLPAGRLNQALELLLQAHKIRSGKVPSESGKGRHTTMYAIAL